MEKHLHLLTESLEQARLALHELQMARPNDPRLLKLNHHLWTVKHGVDGAASALVDVAAELAHLKDLRVNL